MANDEDQQQKKIQQALIHLDEAWGQLSRRVAADTREHPYTIPRSQVHLLRLLDRLGPQRMSDLACLLGISQGTCTTVVDRAIDAQLVIRERDQQDRRVVRVAISEHGEEILDEVRHVRAEILSRYLTQLSSDEIEILAGLYQRIAGAALYSAQASVPK